MTTDPPAPTDRDRDPDHDHDPRDPERDGDGGRTFPAFVEACLRHPLWTVAAVAAFGALVSAFYIWHVRQLGSYDPDEAGYLATALRYHRALVGGGPLEVVDEVADTTLGPLVPLLSLPFLVVGPRDPRTAMLVQPVLMVLAAVATAGIARRLVGPGPTILVGAFVAAMPTMLLASQSYWYGLGAATMAACALWALLASERLSNRWWVAYGTALGLMPLARTMALGFLPALALAGLVMAWGDRRSMINLVKAGAVAALVAGPWFVVQHREILDYLFGYGYGDRAGEFGSGGPARRSVDRVWQLVNSTLLPLPLAAVGLLGLSGLGPRRWRTGSWRSPWSPRRREGAALAVVVAAGFLALVSTTNQGVWFELPLVAAIAPLWMVAVLRSPRALRRGLVIAMVAVIVFVPVGLRLFGPGHAGLGGSEYDTRFATARSATAEEAAEEWNTLHERVTDRLGEITGAGVDRVIVVAGNMYLFSSNNILLSAELELWRPDVRVPDTSDAASRAESLEPLSDVTHPDGSGKERVLVVVRHDLQTFVPDRDWRSFEAQARASGWVEVETFAMPVDGEVALYRHREMLGS